MTAPIPPKLRGGTYTDEQICELARDFYATGFATAQRTPRRIAKQNELQRAHREGLARGHEDATRALTIHIHRLRDVLRAVSGALRRPGGRDEALRLLADYEEGT